VFNFEFRISNFEFSHRTLQPAFLTGFRGEGDDAPNPAVFSRFGVLDVLSRNVDEHDLRQARRDAAIRRP